MDGICATAELKKRLPSSQVVVLTIFEDVEYEARAIEAGASAFVSKKQMGSKLIPTINELIDAKAE
jgi:two-component system response regulator NreC